MNHELPAPSFWASVGLGAAPARRRLRVLHLIETLGRGGAERNLVNVLLHLPRGEHAVCYLHPPDDYVQTLARAGIPVRCLQMGGRLDIARLIRQIQIELERGAFHLLFTQIWLADILGRIGGSLARVPVLSAVQTSAYEPETLATYSFAGRMKTHLWRRTLDALTAHLFLRRFVAASRFSGTQICKRLWLPKERVVVVPNSVDLDRFHPLPPAARLRLREEMGVRAGDQILVSVGKMNKGKGNDILIHAMPHVLRQVPRAQLWLLGIGPDRDALGRLAARCGAAGAVRFLGQQADVERYLWTADLFVFASRFEGMPLAVLEAMACGVPCILSDIPPHREVSDGGRLALLVPPEPRAWGEAILSHLGQPQVAHRLAEAARQHTVAHYDARAVAQTLDALFQREARRSPWDRGPGLGDWLRATRGFRGD
ncbi:MAG: glycosyltransferase [Myxococcales bacterium]|nr:glycosyltransferase [Myxococcota bacterium]MDW8281229.1 glycosyltransferase [Myxococcales bacterium]